MKIQDVLREISHSGPNMLTCKDSDGETIKVWYLDDYHPYRQQGVKNWHFNQVSSVMLHFKRGEPEAIGYYLLKILGNFRRKAKYRDIFEDENVRFAAVPGHEAGNFDSSIHKLTRMLAAYYNREDYSKCLVRRYKVSKLSQGGCRSKQVHYLSMAANRSFDLQGKTIILIDDIVTTGNSLAAGKKVLLEAGAREVFLLALGDTVLEPETLFASKRDRDNPVRMDDVFTCDKYGRIY